MIFLKRPALQQYSNPACPVQLLQGDWEFRQLLRTVSALRPLRVLEIGSLFGGTLWHWLQLMQPFGFLMSIDHVVPPDDPRYDEQVAGHRGCWQAWGAERHITVRVWDALSHDPAIVGDVVDHFPEGIDFLFIDGGHDYQTVYHDFTTYGALVRSGGVIALHDILPASDWPEIEVPRLWREIQQSGHITQELYSDSEQNLWGIGVVYKR